MYMYFVLNHKLELLGPCILPSQFRHLVSPVIVKSDAVQFPSYAYVTLFLGAANHQNFEPQAGQKKFATTNILRTLSNSYFFFIIAYWKKKRKRKKKIWKVQVTSRMQHSFPSAGLKHKCKDYVEGHRRRPSIIKVVKFAFTIGYIEMGR